MVTCGFIFPGQGAQFVGMGRDVYEASARARAVYTRAHELSGTDVAHLCFEGPAEVLTQTVNAQMAIFTMSCALREVIAERFPALRPAVTCGLSLGEYPALVAAGIFDFDTALRIVQKRGALMEKAATASPGGMVSVIGLPETDCREVAAACDVDVANFNSPEQIVLSGLKEHIARAQEAAVARGAKKAIILNVSGAFHSRLMAPAAEGMQAVLKDVTPAKPQTLFVPNVTGEAEGNPAVIKAHLVAQVTQSVQWTKSMQYAAANGVRHFLEIGPGNVLKGLARRINKELSVLSVQSVSQLDELESFLTAKE